MANDEPFGILTRPALELVMASYKANAILYVVDFNQIHHLNQELGYAEVNRIIRTMIQEFYVKFPGLTIGRVFSGDEIAIIDDGCDASFRKNKTYQNLMGEFAEICSNYRIGFKYTDRGIILGKSPRFHGRQLNKLSEKIRFSNYSKIL